MWIESKFLWVSFVRNERQFFNVFCSRLVTPVSARFLSNLTKVNNSGKSSLPLRIGFCF